jgi:Ca2+-binding RTX toxin-like protein
LSGRGGNDDIRARGGSDVAQGGPGNDDVYGMEGSDRDVAGGVGNDNLYGGLGDDTLRAAGDGDSDNVYCDEGTDTAIVEVGDLVDDQRIVSETVVPTGTSCEVILVEGLPLP